MVLEHKQLQRLAAEAGSDDRAWNELVRRLAPLVDAQLARAEGPPAEEEHVRRAVWRGLARRLELHAPPPDVRDWLLQRVAIELGRGRLHLVVDRAVRPGGDLPERRSSRERRASVRGTPDRRQQRQLTPDGLAARLQLAGPRRARVSMGRGV